MAAFSSSNGVAMCPKDTERGGTGLGWPARFGGGAQRQLHALVGCGEPERLVEPDRVRPAPVGGELNQPAPSGSRPLDGPDDHPPPETGGAEGRVDPDAL